MIGRARDRFGAAVAAFDADGDGRLDLYLAAAVVGPKGVRDALLLNKGDGTFEDVTASYGLPDDRASLGVAAGDFDADRRVDLFLTGVGDNRLYRNVAARSTSRTSPSPRGRRGRPARAQPVGRWIDLDQDGDLDLYVVNSHRRRARRPTPSPTGRDPRPRQRRLPQRRRCRRRSRPPAGQLDAPGRRAARRDLPARGLSIELTPWPDADALLGGPARHTGGGRRSISTTTATSTSSSTADGQGPVAVLNDRLGRFHRRRPGPRGRGQRLRGLLAADFDKDGRTDLVAARAGLRPPSGGTPRSRAADGFKLAFERDQRPGCRAGRRHLVRPGPRHLARLLALAGGDASVVEAPSWVRFGEPIRPRSRPLALAPDPAGVGAVRGLALANLVGDALPDLILWRDGQAPTVAANLGNGRHWLALDLGGRWKTDFDLMRTNPHASARGSLSRGRGSWRRYNLITPESGRRSR